MSLHLQAKKEVTVQVGVIEPDYQGNAGPLLHNGDKEEDVGNTETGVF